MLGNVIWISYYKSPCTNYHQTSHLKWLKFNNYLPREQIAYYFISQDWDH